MTDNSLQNLLKRLEQGNVTHGWGVIVTYSRDQVNRLLARQHIEGLDGLRFLLPYTETFYVNDDRTEEMELRGIVMGAPILSFETASLNRSALTLTMNIVGGSFSSQRHAAGVPPTLLKAITITEDMGFYVRMTVDLGQAYGEVDKQGRLTVDLSVSEKVTCNLGSTERIRERMGQYFQRYFAGQPEQQRRFTIGKVELNSYDPLSPTAFAVRTQRAPGADNERAVNYGDGAIVVFIRIKAQEGEPPAGLPIEGSNFPYLIPDDLSGTAPRYSASLLVARPYLHLVDERQLEVLGNMMFPGDNRFVESEDGRYSPYDLAIFGNVALTPNGLVIEPSSVELGTAATQQFLARYADGSIIPAVQWTVRSPDYPNLVGTIAANGVYTASAQSAMRRDRLPVVVTATYDDEGVEKRTSALVHERYERINIAPVIQIKSGTDMTPVTLRATTIGTAPLQFRLLEPTLGARLEPLDANSQNYFPPSQLQSEPLLMQYVESWEEGGRERALAAILLINKPMYLPVEPWYVTGMAPEDTVQLRVGGDIDPALLNWSVIGDGAVENGVYTAPAQSESWISVVVCELPPPNPVFPPQWGYSVINRQPVQQQYVPVRWESLLEFSVEAPGGLTACYSNGYQQIPVVIKLETNPVNIDGQDVQIPVSDVELSKLQLVDLLTGQVVPFVDSFEDGINHGDSADWAVHVRPNRFRLYSSGEAGPGSRYSAPQPANNATRYREFFIHMAVDGARSFYAQFQADNGSWWRSNEDIGGEGTITVRGVRPPSVDPTPGPGHSYELHRERVYNGDGYSGEEGDPGKDFDFYLSSVDHWRLTYKKMGLYPIAFSTVEFEGNISTIQWESEYLEEKFFSYTGQAFYPMPYGVSDRRPAGLSFDVFYRALARRVLQAPVDEQFHGDAGPPPGGLIFSLHRVADMPYWYDALAGGDPLHGYRARLDPPVVFVLLDEEGNRHKLQVGFAPPTLPDSRNELRLQAR
ncbi:hypothetical protein J3P77_08945 [Pseudomonas sp. R1-18]|uniref:hypothetical protein n=1 Tax=Pseudomonas sp. R1-18 TaxID=1632772 RepID=UPI003DA87F1C